MNRILPLMLIIIFMFFSVHNLYAAAASTNNKAEEQDSDNSTPTLYSKVVDEAEAKIMLCLRESFIQCNMCSFEGFSALLKPCMTQQLKKVRNALHLEVESELNRMNDESIYDF